MNLGLVIGTNVAIELYEMWHSKNSNYVTNHLSAITLVFQNALFCSKYGLNFTQVLAKAVNVPAFCSPIFTGAVVLSPLISYVANFTSERRNLLLDEVEDKEVWKTWLLLGLANNWQQIAGTVYNINWIATVVLLAGINIPAAVALGAFYLTANAARWVPTMVSSYEQIRKERLSLDESVNSSS